MSPSRYTKLISIFTGASLSAQMEYKVNFVSGLLQTILATGGTLLGIKILFDVGNNVGGWGFDEAMLLVGIFTIFDGLAGVLFYPNLLMISGNVRTGGMDFVLLKPIDSQFLVSYRNINLLRIPSVLVGLAIMIWGMVQVNASVQSIFVGTLLLVCAFAIVYSISFALATTAFWFVRVDNILELFWGFYRAGQFPVTAFPGWVRTMFTFVIPIAFITTIPAQAFAGKVPLASALTALCVALILLVASRAFWKIALKNYTSASS